MNTEKIVCCYDHRLFKNYDSSLTENGIIVYAGICFNFFGQKSILLTYNYLKAIIYGNSAEESKRKIAKKGFDELVEKNIIDVLYKTNKEEFVCNVSRISKPEGLFSYIKYDDFDKIIKLNNPHSGNLIKYFLCCISTFNKDDNQKYNYKFGDKPQSYLYRISGINIPTMNKYNKILQENGIMYIAKRKEFVGGIHSGKLYKPLTNMYCRYSDKDICEKYIKENTTTIKNKNEYVNITNEMRSLSQKYNYFKKTYENTTCEDIEKVMRAYNAAKQWNEYAKQDYENAILDGKKVDEPEYKDLSIFDKYDLTV